LRNKYSGTVVIKLLVEFALLLFTGLTLNLSVAAPLERFTDFTAFTDLFKAGRDMPLFNSLAGEEEAAALPLCCCATALAPPEFELVEEAVCPAASDTATVVLAA